MIIHCAVHTLIDRSLGHVSDRSCLHNVTDHILYDGLVFRNAASTVCAAHWPDMATTVLGPSIVPALLRLKSSTTSGTIKNTKKENAKHLSYITSCLLRCFHSWVKLNSSIYPIMILFLWNHTTIIITDYLVARCRLLGLASWDSDLTPEWTKQLGPDVVPVYKCHLCQRFTFSSNHLVLNCFSLNILSYITLSYITLASVTFSCIPLA